MTIFDGTWNNVGTDPFSDEQYDLTYEFDDAYFTMTNNKTGATASGTFSFDGEYEGTISFFAPSLDDEWFQNYKLSGDKLGLQIDDEDHWNGWFSKEGG